MLTRRNRFGSKILPAGRLSFSRWLHTIYIRILVLSKLDKIRQILLCNSALGGIIARSVHNQVPGPVVRTQDGQIIGKFGKNLDGESFLQFFGIPYGKAPVGVLRFKPPQPVDPWEGIKDATKVGSASISIDDITKEIVGSEDCLFLNVYTKNLPRPQSKLKPVMVFIHGGGLTGGSSRPGMYGPEFLMTEDIVLVTLNYRLGVLGFLASDDPAIGITGNMGLKDQTLALKWVQKNISNFNGDQNNVTLFGESAGAWSVHAHILSQASKGLFHKAILQSGCALNSRFWGSKNNARMLVKELGKSANTEKEAVQILEGCTGMELFNVQTKIFGSPFPKDKRNFAAVIEPPNDTAFFTKSPVEILKEEAFNKVPIIMGYTETEGMINDSHKSMLVAGGYTLPDFDMKNFIPYEIRVPRDNSTDLDKICGILEKVYLSESNRKHYDEMTDSYFLVGKIETLRYQLKSSETPIYMYRMSLAGQLNYFKRLTDRINEPGVCHADDLGYLFKSDITPEVKPGSPEDKSIRTFVELWTNFAKYGNPTPNDKLNVLWKPVESEENIQLLDIGEKLVFKEIPENNRVQAWLSILKKWPLNNFD